MTKKDVLDFSAEETIKTIAETFDIKKELFLKKSEGYTCAYKSIANVIEVMIGTTNVKIKTLDDIRSFQLAGRMIEKFMRYMNIRFGTGKDSVGEDPSITLEDISVYALMLVEIEKSRLSKMKKEKE
jgi:hypothetical protein